LIVKCSLCRAIQGRKPGVKGEVTHTVGECCAEYAFEQAGFDWWLVQAQGTERP
jgi:hypothetical protein